MVTATALGCVRWPQQTWRGFTLIEMLVVMAALGLLLAIVAPQYARHVEQTRETVLKQNLRGVREALDKFYADRARYPSELQELVRENYLRELPMDPITERADSWVVEAPRGGRPGAVGDVRSGALGRSRDGSTYAAW